MTIAEAKQLRIVDYLASLGYHPQSVISKQYWYLSPLRDERTPSFKVNDRLNEWYDFGAATGGDLVELGKYLYRTNSVSEVLACIGRHENAAPIQRVRIPGTTPRPVEADMKDVLVVPLQHHALLSYLHSRGIDGDIGRMFCREVHYELRKRRYFALAFGNAAGGYEVRNPYYKGCIRCKDISVIRQSHGDAPCDYLVMNSVNNLKKALEHLQVYEEIHCYLDNDLAGQKTEETIAGMYGGRVRNEAPRYREYKDLNDYLRGKKR